MKVLACQLGFILFGLGVGFLANPNLTLFSSEPFSLEIAFTIGTSLLVSGSILLGRVLVGKTEDLNYYEEDNLR